MVDHNIILRVREVFYCKLFVPEKAEKLDKSITEGMLAAELICLIIYRLPWDEITHEVMTSRNIIKCHLSVLKNG